jgi:replicative DNA helicase
MSSVTLSRDLPRAVEAEASVLGGVIVENNRLADVAGWLKAEHFTQHWAGLVFRAMVSLAKSNTPIDYITVKQELGPAMSDVGIERLSKLGDGVPRSTNVEYYARLVLDVWRRREAIAKATQVIEAALELGAEADDVIAKGQESFFRLASTRRSETLWTAGQMTSDIFKEFESLEQRDHEISGLSTGIRDLDDMTFGLQPGELVVIGARPSVGKTGIALQVAMHAASEGHVLFCSLEMGHRSVWRRAVFNTAKVDGFSYQRGRLKGDQTVYTRIAHALEVLRPLRFTLDEQPGMTSVDVRSRAQQIQLRHGLSLVVVDYLQLMRPSDPVAAKKQNRTQIVGEMAWDLKETARTLGVPVIALSQLTRMADEKTKPTMAQLRESGDIEAHADIILLMHRRETRAQLDDLEIGQPTHVELLVEKQRGNPTGMITLLNFRESYRFVSLAQHEGDLVREMEHAS